MLNLLSIRCSLAFAPYLYSSLSQFIEDGKSTPEVIRQGGSGLTIRADGALIIRHQDREVKLGALEARHFWATVRLRLEQFEVRRSSAEIVMANTAIGLLLSFPQSEIWLDAPDIECLLRMQSGADAANTRCSLPDWLIASASEGQLLLSDQRNARWVLLGPDHLQELDSRRTKLESPSETVRRRAPRIQVKGLELPLAFCFKVASCLEQFVESRQVERSETALPESSIVIRSSTEGIEFVMSDRRVAFNAREAAKWAAVLRGELAKLNAVIFRRGQIETVLTAEESGRWVIQAGDEVFLPADALSVLSAPRREGERAVAAGTVAVGLGEFLLLLNLKTSACVALTGEALSSLRG